MLTQNPQDEYISSKGVLQKTSGIFKSYSVLSKISSIQTHVVAQFKSFDTCILHYPPLNLSCLFRHTLTQ